MTELLPCPFCGSTNIEALARFNFVACQGCGASLEDVEPSARELWNTRTTPPAVTTSEQVKEALEPCKIEHTKFEEWAASEGYDMHEHPLHYLFMDPKTNAARKGWKAALQYIAALSPSYIGTTGKPGEQA
jgi:hypothetical protein